MKTLALAFEALYYMTDHPLWLHDIGVLNFSDKTYDRLDFINNFVDLMAEFFTAAVSLREMKRLSVKLQLIKSNSD